MPAFIMRIKVAELHKLYQNNLETLGMDIIAVNRFRLNTELLEFFQNSTVQEQFDGTTGLLVFSFS